MRTDTTAVTQDHSADQNTELTEVTLDMPTDDGPDHWERRDLTQAQLVGLLHAFDDCEDPDDPDEFVKVSLVYPPAEYHGRRWRDTRSFTRKAASTVLEAFEAGDLI